MNIFRYSGMFRRRLVYFRICLEYSCFAWAKNNIASNWYIFNNNNNNTYSQYSEMFQNDADRNTILIGIRIKFMTLSIWFVNIDLLLNIRDYSICKNRCASKL